MYWYLKNILNETISQKIDTKFSKIHEKSATKFPEIKITFLVISDFAK
jgi:hypothetical protein